MFKFFSKNKKSGLVLCQDENRFPNTDTKWIKRDDEVKHSSGICSDCKFYNTENSEKVIFNQTDSIYNTACYGRTYFVTANGNWFSAHTFITRFRKENQEENTITTWVHIVYGSLQIEDKENIKMLLGNKDIDLYKKYFGEVEEG